MSAELNYKRHVSELIRIFLPIFVIVCTIAIVLWAVFAPKKKQEIVRKWEERVGLIHAGEDAVFDPAFALVSPAEMVAAPVASRFDAPMGSEHAALTYNAQPFLTTRHLGDDINGIGGENSDLGDAVYAAADGKVIYTGWPADGWGNIVIVLHQQPDGKMIESFYGHLKQIFVPIGAVVKRGEQIGTVGKADGRYLAHLHFELRDYTSVSPGAGYGDSALGRLSGELFLKKQRAAPDDRLNPAIEGEVLLTPNAGISIGIEDEK